MIFFLRHKKYIRCISQNPEKHWRRAARPQGISYCTRPRGQIMCRRLFWSLVRVYAKGFLGEPPKVSHIGVLFCCGHYVSIHIWPFNTLVTLLLPMQPGNQLYYAVECSIGKVLFSKPFFQFILTNLELHTHVSPSLQVYYSGGAKWLTCSALTMKYDKWSMMTVCSNKKHSATS